MHNKFIAFSVCAFMMAALSNSTSAQQKYAGVCDVSAGVAIGPQHFLAVADEYKNEPSDLGDKLFLYPHADSGKPHIRAFSLPGELRTNPDKEIDTEGAARVGNRIYWITSHGRSKKGKLRPNRYSIYATDISGAGKALKIQFAGFYKNLVIDLIETKNWADPSSERVKQIVAKLKKTTRLGEVLEKFERKNLAPKKNGLNIEGLAAMPDNSGLLIGLRNPVPNGKAVVIRLRNAPDLLTGQETKGRFDGPFDVDLHGWGIRSIQYVQSLNSFLIIGGPKDNGGPFKLFRWAGPLTKKTILIKTLHGGKRSSPEALLIYPDRDQILVLNDEGKKQINGFDCNKLPPSQQSFSGRWYKFN